MDDTEGNSSMDSFRNSQSSPLPQVTPRLPQIPMMMSETPLSTKRERQAITPRLRRPAPKMIKTMPPTRSTWFVRKESFPLLVTPQGPKPLESPKYDHTNGQSFFEQVFQIDEMIGRGSFGEVFAASCHNEPYGDNSFRYQVRIAHIQHDIQFDSSGKNDGVSEYPNIESVVLQSVG